MYSIKLFGYFNIQTTILVLSNNTQKYRKIEREGFLKKEREKERKREREKERERDRQWDRQRKTEREREIRKEIGKTVFKKEAVMDENILFSSRNFSIIVISKMVTVYWHILGHHIQKF